MPLTQHVHCDAQMWNCPKCGESSDDTFAVCWHCGTDRDGNEDPGFRPVSELVDAGTELAETERPQPWQFSLWSLFLLVTCVALILGLIHGLPRVVVEVVVGIVIANLLGLILGFFVTYVLRIPDDGSLPSYDEESEPPSLVDNDSSNR